MADPSRPTQALRRRGRRPAQDDALPAGPGRAAHHPLGIPWRGWRQVLGRTFRDMTSDRIALVAAGVAFWATLSLVPAISMLISLYGLIFDPSTVEPQLENIRHLLPAPAFQMISERVRTLVSHPSTALGVSLLVSSVFTLWSASTGVRTLLSALNLAYEETERRGFLVFQAVGLGMTLGAMLAAIVGLACLLLLPAIISFLGLTAHEQGLLETGTFAVLLVFVLLSLSVLYRFGPSRRAARWHWVSPGSLVATLLWLVASLLFTVYVQRFASYNALYGPLSAVAGIMMWFWVSAYVVLLGAELNAELELQTAEDTTTDGPRPMGERGAFVADHVADE